MQEYEYKLVYPGWLNPSKPGATEAERALNEACAGGWRLTYAAGPFAVFERPKAEEIAD